jgi:hypothetical protein
MGAEGEQLSEERLRREGVTRGLVDNLMRRHKELYDRLLPKVTIPWGRTPVKALDDSSVNNLFVAMLV